MIRRRTHRGREPDLTHFHPIELRTMQGRGMVGGSTAGDVRRDQAADNDPGSETAELVQFENVDAYLATQRAFLAAGCDASVLREQLEREVRMTCARAYAD